MPPATTPPTADAPAADGRHDTRRETETNGPDAARARIEVVGVHKAYVLGSRRVEALRGADLTIDRPGFYSVMGASGSGKSTLLHLLAGLDRPDAGRLIVGDVEVGSLPERDLTLYRRRDIGVVFQQFNLLPTMSALENVVLPGVLDRRPHVELEAAGMRLLDELGLADRAHHRPDAMSGGEQQRVAIARALLFSPPVLLADEPTGNLDSETSARLWTLLRELAGARRMIVLMVTHEPEAASHCERVFVIRDGTVAGSFDVDGIPPSELAVRAAELGRTSG